MIVLKKINPSFFYFNRLGSKLSDQPSRVSEGAAWHASVRHWCTCVNSCVSSETPYFPYPTVEFGITEYNLLTNLTYPVICRFPLLLNCVITIHQRYETDRRTDRRTDGRHARRMSGTCILTCMVNITGHLECKFSDYMLVFTARRLAKRGICRRRVSVCVCVCVCHTPVLYQNG